MSGAKLVGLFLVLTGIVTSAVLLAVIPASSSAASITWERDYEKAVERAQAEKKLLIAYGFTDWCVICKRMDAETFVEPQLIRDMADKYVWMKLNTEKEEDGIRFQKEFGILTYPTILLLDSEGEEIDRIERFLDGPQFTETVDAFIDNPSPDSLVNLRKAVRAQPNSASARYALAEKLLDRNSYSKAAVEFKKVVELDPENREGKTDLSQYNVALCLASELKFEDAIVELDLLDERFPNGETVPDAKMLRGQVYHCCGKYDLSEAVLREYVTKYPTHAHVPNAIVLLDQMQAAAAAKD